MTGTNSKQVFLLFLLLFSFLFASSQEAEVIEEEDRVGQVNSLLSFYRYMLNTVGSEKTATRDKETIITQSYKKAFRDELVQIEDDLLRSRNAITNKNVTAYLRDVDFFFRDISFEFTEMEITKSSLENGKDYYLAAFNSTLTGTTLEGEPFTRSGKRYIEINFDELDEDLKIVSIYSTKISREEELRNWWKNLSYEWGRIFQDYVMVGDSITKDNLYKMAAIDSLDLSGNRFIQDLEPLTALNNLQYLNISQTRISELQPLRYALKLETLLAEDTRIKDIGLLQYFQHLKKLDLSHTEVSDISVISRLEYLEWMDLSSTSVTDFDAFQHIEKLEYLDVSKTTFSYPALISSNWVLEYLDLSGTGVSNLHYLESLPALTYLDISETYVSSLNDLQTLQGLRVLKCNQTQVRSLDPLRKLKSLEKVYCDGTGIDEQHALSFMGENSGVLVISNSKKLVDWWDQLDFTWKEALLPYLPHSKPDKEELTRLTNLDSLDISNRRLLSGGPLAVFKNLRYLAINKTLITDLVFCQSLEDLEVFSGDNLPVSSLQGMGALRNLRKLSMKRSQVSSLAALANLNQLEEINLEGTPVSEKEVEEFLIFNPDVVIIFQTGKLLEWWEGLSPNWHKIFNLPDGPSPRELHKLVESEEYSIKQVPVSSLSPLDPFLVLRNLEIDQTNVSSLAELSGHRHLEKLTCKNGPLSDLEGVSDLVGLKYLDISNTAVKDVRSLRSLISLEELNVSGTNMRSLRGLENLKYLSFLNISNTRVWQLDRLYDIRSLIGLVCYNTRVSTREIERFKELFPDCIVNYY